MTTNGARPVDLAVGALLLVLVVIAVAAFGVAVRRKLAARSSAPAPVPTVAPIAMPVAPIAWEAGVFHTVANALALAPAAPRVRSAHPRTRTTYRFLRAFPGAPPRIPHPLTAEEFRSGTCRTCHERGGYSPRFNAYVPLTPHAERGPCLQCHVGVDSVLGYAVAGADPSTRCALCHGNGGRPRADVSTTWPTSVWPTLPQLVRDQSPPPIPHDLMTRQNCLACHGGPAAVAELRTTHPERTDCRECHVRIDSEPGPFAHVAVAFRREAGGAR